MVQNDIYHNCRNCEKRFECNEKTQNGFCENYEFDNEAATCDDCSKRESCENYIENKPTCVSWEPEICCNECYRQEICKNFTDGGRICNKFKEIEYTLTEKGCLYVAIESVQKQDNMCVDLNSLFENGFFEKLEHEIKLNGLFLEYDNIFEKVFKELKFKIFKPKKSTKDVFLEVAHSKLFFKYFDMSDDIVEKVCDRFFETLQKHYKDLNII